MDNFNIVMLGKSFPVESVDLSDFDFLGRPVVERMRLPVVLEAQAGEFIISVLPDRFQVGVVDARDSVDKIEAVLGAARLFLEYVGRRTVTAVGHNFQATSSEARGSGALGSLVDYAAVSALIGTQEPVEVDLETRFPSEHSTFGRLKLKSIARDQLGLDLNYHFELGAGGGGFSVEAAIECFEVSLNAAREVFSSVSTQMSGVPI